MNAGSAKLPTPNAQLPTRAPGVEVGRWGLGVGGALTVQCVRDHWGFTLLRPHWNELLRASAADNPFLTWEWLHTWWTQLGGPDALHVIVVRAGDEPIAIAPLRLVNGRLACFSRLEFLGTGFDRFILFTVNDFLNIPIGILRTEFLCMVKHFR